MVSISSFLSTTGLTLSKNSGVFGAHGFTRLESMLFIPDQVMLPLRFAHLWLTKPPVQQGFCRYPLELRFAALQPSRWIAVPWCHKPKGLFSVGFKEFWTILCILWMNYSSCLLILIVSEGAVFVNLGMLWIGKCEGRKEGLKKKILVVSGISREFQKNLTICSINSR